MDGPVQNPFVSGWPKSCIRQTGLVCLMAHDRSVKQGQMGGARAAR